MRWSPVCARPAIPRPGVSRAASLFRIIIEMMYFGPNQISMKRRSRKKLVRLILLPIVSLVILILIAIAILYSQQQRLVGLAVKELNKQLPGELVVGGSDISVFQNF